MQLYVTMITPSTCVTARHASNPNNVPCDIVGRICMCVVGSAVESSLAKRGTRVRFPDDADYIFTLTPRKHFDAVCYRFKKFYLRNGMSVTKSLILSKQLYDQLFVQNTS